MPNKSIISIKDLSKTYQGEDGQLVEALQGINIEICEEEFVSIVGVSGCGKTTLLYIVAGLIPSTSGAVYKLGKEVVGPQEDIGIVFQSAVLLPWRTVLENVMLPVEVLRLEKKVFKEKALELIELAGLKGFENSKPRELSGGMQQRVSICRALIHNPGLLLMDEPFGALDALTREKMNLELNKVCERQKKTILFITHSISEAVFLSDRVVVLSPRPGRVHRIYQIELPKPRGPEVQSTAAFASYVADIRQDIMGSEQS